MISAITIHYKYDAHNKEGKIIYNDIRTINYKYDTYDKRLTVSNNLNQSISIDNIDKMDVNEIGCEIAVAALLPDEIDELGAPVSVIEDYIISGFIKNKDINNIHNSIFLRNYDGSIDLMLVDNRTISLPLCGSEYFELNLHERLK